MALTAVPASADLTHPYTGLSFGPDGTSATSFDSVQGVAVDQASEDVYVYDTGAGGKVYKFDSSGAPVSFSALTGNAIEGVGGTSGAENEIAIAPAGASGGTAGDIYVANNVAVKIYDQSGTQLGELTASEPCGVATDPAGHVFVGVYPSEVIEYTPSADPVTNADQTAISSGVVQGICNVAADGLGNIYAAKYNGEVSKLEGLGDSSASLLDSSATTLAVDPATNDVYANREVAVRQYDSSGTLLGSFGSDRLVGSRGIAVNAAKGEIYVGNAATNRVEIFGSGVVLPGLTPEPVTAITGTKATLNASVNPDGVAVSECKFEYGLTTAYGSSKPCEGAIPPDSSDHSVSASLAGLSPATIYHFRIVATNTNGTNESADQSFETSATVVTGSATALVGSTATLNGTVSPEGVPFTDCSFEFGLTNAYGSVAPCAETPATIGAGFGPVGVHADLSGLTLGSVYHYRLSATNTDGTVQGSDQSFKTPGASIEAEWVASVAAKEATLKAIINPEGSATTYHLEYGTDTSYGNSTHEAVVGSDEVGHTVTSLVEGLAPGVTYHWRVVATNSVGASEGPDRTFTTHAISSEGEPGCPNQEFRTGSSAHLPDCRAYEMVSPVDKSNGDIITRLNLTGFLTALDQSSVDGNGFTYSSYRAFANPEGAPYTNQFLARRTPGNGWQTKAIDPPRFGDTFIAKVELENDYKAFSGDLSSAWLVHESEPTLSPCAPAGFANIYRRTEASDTYEALNCATPMLEARGFSPELQGFSADGSAAVFRADDKLTANASEATTFTELGLRTNYQVYESIEGDLRLISVLPNGIATTANASAGTALSNDFTNHNREQSVSHAVSSDGTRVFWSTGLSAGPIYLRLNTNEEQSASGACDEADKACTMEVSGSVTSEPAYFQTANSEGTKALFTVIEGPLAGNLYEFDATAEPPASHLIAEKVQVPIPGGNGSKAYGSILGASNDLSRIFFASEEASSAAEAEGAEKGEANIYFYNAGATRFVGALSTADLGTTNNYGSSIRAQPFKRTARVSADGWSAVFMSSSKSTSESVGYDNTDALSGEPDAEVYLYDARAEGQAGKLRCVSCNPTGARPQGREIASGLNGLPGPWGAATVPPFETQLYQSRYLSDDGNRVFFNSVDALVLGDTNGREDVYQWESPGSGNCSLQHSSYTASSEGCLNLISSGQSPADSHFLDASPTGSDVFFTTVESLLVQDYGLIDVYDARVNGGFPPPPNSAAACEGEACQGPLEAPNDPTPASAAFRGAGNVKEPDKARCAKGKARRKGRCVAKKRHKRSNGSATKHRANDTRRVGR